MSSFIWDLLSLPVKKYNTRAVRSVTTEVSAEDFNGMVQAIADLREAVRTGTLKDVSATVLSAANEVRKRVVNGWEEASRNGLGFRRTLISINPKEFGARPWDPEFDNGPCFQAAFERIVTDGSDGFLETDPGDAFWFRTGYVHGRKWINPEHVYAKCPAYNLAPSYDAAAYAANRQLPRIGFKGNGAILVADLDRSGTPQVLFSNFLGESHSKSNQDQFEISGLHFAGVDEFDGITPNFVGDPGVPLEVDNNMVGYFSVISPVKVSGCSARAFKRGAVSADCYSGTRTNFTASHCGKGLEWLGDNGTATIGSKATLCNEYGLVVTGQKATHIGYISEGNACGLQVPACDGVTFLGGYDEDTYSGHTGFRVELGEVADVNTAQAISVVLINWHLFGQYGKPIQLRSAPYTHIISCRSYTTGSVFYDTNSSCKVDGFPIDWTPSAGVTAGLTQFAPAAPGGVIQIGGGSGTTAIKTAQGARYYPDSSVYFYGDGSGRLVVIGGQYVSGNFEAVGQIFSSGGQINGPGTTHTLANNTTSALNVLAHRILASQTLSHSGARVLNVKHAGVSGVDICGVDGSIELLDTGAGIYIKRTDGTRVKITVNNSNAIVVT